MNQLQIQQNLRKNRNLGYAKLENSAHICLLIIALIAYVADMALEIIARLSGKTTFDVFPTWLQYTHIIVMVVAAVTVIASIIVGIPACVHLANSGRMTKPQIAGYVFYFIFTCWFIGLCICVVLFDQVNALKGLIPDDVQPYLLYAGCALVFCAFVCSCVLVGTTNSFKETQVTAEEEKKVEDKKPTQKEAKKEAKTVKKETKKAKKEAKKTKKTAKKAKKAKRSSAKTNKTSQSESVNAMLMSENAELREELDHLKRSRSAEKGWVSRKDEEIEVQEKKNK